MLYKSENKENFFLQCDCHVPLHFLSFSWNDENVNEIFVTYCSQGNSSFWFRLKRSIKYLLGFDSLQLSEVIVSPQELIQLGKDVEQRCVEYLEGKKFDE